MIQNTHTPAPWVVSFRPDGSSYISMGSIEQGHHKQFDLLLFDGQSTDNEDARLIAAAPELLEALEQVLIEYDDVDLADHEPKSFTSAVLSARAVISKARGQS